MISITTYLGFFRAFKNRVEARGVAQIRQPQITQTLAIPFVARTLVAFSLQVGCYLLPVLWLQHVRPEVDVGQGDKAEVYIDGQPVFEHWSAEVDSEDDAGVH